MSKATKIQKKVIKAYAVCQDHGRGFEPIVICFGLKTLMQDNIQKGKTKVCEAIITLKNFNG